MKKSEIDQIWKVAAAILLIISLGLIITLICVVANSGSKVEVPATDAGKTL